MTESNRDIFRQALGLIGLLADLPMLIVFLMAYVLNGLSGSPVLAFITFIIMAAVIAANVALIRNNVRPTVASIFVGLSILSTVAIISIFLLMVLNPFAAG